MIYKTINQHEELSFTVRQLEKKYDCHNSESINTADCDIYKRGEFWVIEYQSKVLYYEYHHPDYPFFEMALHYMNPSKVARWKTVENLTCFRQTIREDAVNWRGLIDTIEEPLTLKQFSRFMAMAREDDFQHHGQYTF